MLFLLFTTPHPPKQIFTNTNNRFEQSTSIIINLGCSARVVEVFANGMFETTLKGVREEENYYTFTHPVSLASIHTLTFRLRSLLDPDCVFIHHATVTIDSNSSSSTNTTATQMEGIRNMLAALSTTTTADNEERDPKMALMASIAKSVLLQQHKQKPSVGITPPTTTAPHACMNEQQQLESITAAVRENTEQIKRLQEAVDRIEQLLLTMAKPVLTATATAIQ